jgi:hypothetical protein
MQKRHRFLLTGSKAGVPKLSRGTWSKRCAAQNAVKRHVKKHQPLPCGVLFATQFFMSAADVRCRAIRFQKERRFTLSR